MGVQRGEGRGYVEKERGGRCGTGGPAEYLKMRIVGWKGWNRS